LLKSAQRIDQPKTLVSAQKRAGKRVSLKEFNDSHAQASSIAKKIKKFYARDTGAFSVALLVRSGFFLFVYRFFLFFKYILVKILLNKYFITLI
jgi:superfamily I DNA/RNA helicase